MQTTSLYPNGQRRICLLLFGLFALAALDSNSGRAETLLSCTEGTTGDFYYRGFYVPSYPGKSLDSVRLVFSASLAADYGLTLTARSNTYDGPVLGTASQTFTLAANSPAPVTFDFPTVRITKSSRVCFALTLDTNPSGGSLYYRVGGDCTNVIETQHTTPPLDTFRRNGVNIVITGQDTLLVSPGDSIQAAIDAAAPGETVYVEAGNYTEDIHLRSDVNVFGAGFNVTTLRGTGGGSVVTATAVTNTELHGFKITHSGSTGNMAGVAITGGNPLINQNWIIGNLNGVYIASSGGDPSSAVLRNNLIEQNGNNTDGYLHYGIICLYSTPLIANNLVVRNQGAGMYFAWAASSGAQVINNTVAENTNEGIWCYHEANVIIKNNISVGNSTGISASHGAVPLISFNDVWNNGFHDYDSQSGGVATPGLGDFSADPLFDMTTALGFALGEGSPCVDAGDPAPLYNDGDGSRNDLGAYGGATGLEGGLGGTVTSGFVFNEIGKIPVSEVTRTGASAGLANVSASVASALHIYPDRDAPFGGNLWLGGLFGISDTQVTYYRIFAAPWTNNTPPSLADFRPLTDPLSKIRYTISPGGNVVASLVNVGPDDQGLYLRTVSGYWSHPDLKLIWNTRRVANGRYDLLCKGYSRTADLIHEVTLATNTLSRITVWVNNSPVTATLDAVRDQAGSLIPECGLIPLASATEDVQFEITASHPDGFLLNYTLEALYGRNRNAGVVAADQYVGAHDSSPPFWSGVTNTLIHSAPAQAAGTLQPWTTCSYQFRLQAWARTTDGFNHIYRRTFNDHYFVHLGAFSPSGCIADLDGDGDVDGADLAIFATQFGRTNCTTTPSPAP